MVFFFCAPPKIAALKLARRSGAGFDLDSLHHWQRHDFPGRYTDACYISSLLSFFTAAIGSPVLESTVAQWFD